MHLTGATGLISHEGAGWLVPAYLATPPAEPYPSEGGGGFVPPNDPQHPMLNGDTGTAKYEWDDLNRLIKHGTSADGYKASYRTDESCLRQLFPTLMFVDWVMLTRRDIQDSVVSVPIRELGQPISLSITRIRQS